MDHEKTPKGRSKSSESLQQEDDLRLEPVTINEFRRLRVQIKTFYEEIKLLSTKSPDGAVNKFKLKFLNDVLRKMTAILGDGHRPFPDFEEFDEADLPTNSDVVLMLSHYTESIGRFHAEHTYSDPRTHKRMWYTRGPKDLEV